MPASHYACQSPLNKIVLIWRRACGVIFEWEGAEEHRHQRTEPGSTSGSRHGVGDLFTALRRQGLIADELVLQLATFLRSLDLFLELIVLAPRTLTANQVRHGGKQGTDDPEHSRIHSGTCPAFDFTAAELSGPKITISLTSKALTTTKIASFRTSASGVSAMARSALVIKAAAGRCPLWRSLSGTRRTSANDCRTIAFYECTTLKKSGL